MAQAYRLKIASPKTKTLQAKTWEFTPNSERVIKIETEQKRDGKRISFLTAEIFDPGLSLLASFPDPAFSDVPIELYLAEPGNALSVPVLAFDGKVTSLQFSHPEPEVLTVVAHDHSIDARKKKRYRTFRNLKSTQLVQSIAKEYGFSVTVDTGVADVKQNNIHIGAELSDWDHMVRALAADGLELVMTPGKKLRVRQAASEAYKTLRRGDPVIISLSGEINHVSSGDNANVKQPVAFENAGTQRALDAVRQSEGDASGAETRTHRRPVQSAPTTNKGAHTEDVSARSHVNRVTELRRRKDKLMLTTTTLPDIGLHHVINLTGFGAKVDRTWWLDGIKQKIAGEGFGMTLLEMGGPPSKAALQSGGLPFENRDTVKLVG